MNVPQDRHWVTTDDGRVFYDLDELVRHYDAIISVMEVGAEALDEDREYVAGQRWLLSQIASARDLIHIKAMDGVAR